MENQLLIEGPNPKRDYSYQSHVVNVEPIRDLEKGIPLREFYHERKHRQLEIEYKLLTKITETEQHLMQLIDINPEIGTSNRYNDIIPYKDNLLEVTDCSYFNGSLISGVIPEHKDLFIATQGPLSCTTQAFWQMIFDYNVKLIIMMCQFEESGVYKCDIYFPTSIDEPLTVEPFVITLVKETQSFPTLIKRRIHIKNTVTDDEINIKHFQSIAWPDHGTPNLIDEYEALNCLVYNIKKEASSQSKIVVHCSAGIGRTGTVIGIFNIVTTLEKQILESEEGENSRVSVFGTVRRLREERWGMVQTQDQYEFIYKYVEVWITAYLQYLENTKNN